MTTDFRPLPTIRKKILKSFLGVVLLYGGFGCFLVVSVFLASEITPRLINKNYDSIAALNERKSTLQIIKNPESYAQAKTSELIERFERALKFEESNVIEVGE